MPLSPAAFAPPQEGPANLLGRSRAGLAGDLAALDLPPFRARQLFSWIHCRGARDFAAMTSLAVSLRETLAARFTVARPAVAADLTAADGTRKWLLRLADGHEIETVFIPGDGRGTLCVSSQVGCTLTCRFCHTGTQRLVRNLSAAEIVGQIVLARDMLDDWPSGRPGRIISNIVLMGMGEPLYNFAEVATAVRLALDGDGLAFSRRRITLSTAGVVPLMARCGRELGVRLAVSLHATSDELRSRLVPLNRRWPLAELMAACRAYPGLGNARRITFEYVMLRGVNDSAADARSLVRLIAGIPAKVNLIPFNPWPGAPFERSTDRAVAAFAGIVAAAGYPSPVRSPRGEDILAACGQLRSASRRPGRRPEVAVPA